MSSTITQAAAVSESAEDARKEERVTAARAFTSQLLKAIKQIGMYRHNEARFPEFLEKAHEALTAYTDAHGPLTLKVEASNLTSLGQPLFAEDSALPYKFYRDGIRQLIFRTGLRRQELVKFTLIALSEPERGAEDVVTQLWGAELENIEYVVVEGFRASAGDGEEDVEVEIDQVVGYLYNRLRTSSADYLRFARVSASDLEHQLEEVEQLRGLVVTGRPASDALKAQLQGELAKEENETLFPRLVSALFAVLEEGLGDPMSYEEVFVQLLDLLLLQEDFASILQIRVALGELEQREGEGSRVGPLRDEFVRRMGEEIRLTRIAEALKVSRPKDPVQVSRYFEALEPGAVINLLTALEGIELPENRRLVLDALVRFAKEQPGPFVHRLNDERPQVVRDMIYVLDRVNHPDKMKMFAQVLAHPSLALRLEVMHILASSDNPEARRVISEALQDESAQVRMLAARLLPELHPEHACSALMKLVLDPAFERRSLEERTAIYTGLGASGVPQAHAHLSEVLLQKGNLLNRKRVLEAKLLAIGGLAAAASIQSYKLLQTVIEEKGQAPELVTAARRASYQVKKVLFGDAAPHEEG